MMYDLGWDLTHTYETREHNSGTGVLAAQLSLPATNMGGENRNSNNNHEWD